MSDPLVLVRAVHLLATILVTGTVFFRVYIAEPSLGRVSASLLARIRVRSSHLLAVSLAVATISGLAWLGILAARIGGSSLLDAFGETSWIVLTQTQFGTVWQVRLALALVLAVGPWRSGSDATPVRNIIAVGASACFAGALAWSGHGAATPGNAGDLHLAADILHLIAAAVWLGGLVPLVMLMRWLLRSIDENGSVILLDVLRRFSSLGLLAVATLIITGALNAYFILGSAEALLAGDYGRALMTKLALFVVMVAIAATNRLKLDADLTSASADPRLAARITRRIQVNASAEIGLGVAIVLLVGWLGILAPGVSSHGHLH